jgi:hypothetical protein
MRAIAVALGAVFLALTVIYFTVPADALPLPSLLGYQPGLTKIHGKHGIVSLLVAVACFAFAWFRGGSRST